MDNRSSLFAKIFMSKKKLTYKIMIIRIQDKARKMAHENLISEKLYAENVES